ncbi:gas vesicle structural protein GvpA [Alteribacillus sp. JSM 102045]|uniref:gas vesicle structural protein GvpA n=1 Tax=Alteribacillus sp. JSM 102045 TaxID=1562101 RepID=UPI0035BEC0AF
MAAIQKSTDSSSLAEVIDRILDKGIVIDLYARVSLVGIELITVEARVVIASVDTWLRYAEAVGLLRDEVQGEIDNETGANERGQQQLNFA